MEAEPYEFEEGERNRIYPSKVDAWLSRVVWLAGVVAAAGSLQLLLSNETGKTAIAAFLVALGIVLPAWVFSATDYELGDEELRIRSGPFRWRVKVDSITEVTPTRNPLSSPALSLDRLEIRYDGGKSIMISPREKEAFLADLEEKRRAALDDF
ncbi:MAG TPA: PH domain-containing protein [Planctomycetia bacterium]|nr:PH domain-containing protein [Planctomycetia bacterium]